MKISIVCMHVAMVTLFLPSVASSQRKLSEEAVIFRAIRDGVFTVFGDGGHGTGFLVDSLGLILTNEHVITNSTHVRVQINESTKVAGSVIVSDAKEDVAILFVNPANTRHLPVLKLAPIRDELAFEGEKIIAVGSPLNQVRIMTSGIVSKVEKGAIISDVNINPGNSGGPLINMDSEVIGINTFGDFGDGRGPGISGSIVIWKAGPILEGARRIAPNLPPVSAELLQTMPRRSFPLYALELAARDSEFDEDPYKLRGTGDFEIHVQTPTYLYRKEKKYQLAISKKRKEREEDAKATPEESYNPFDDLKQWAQYAGQYSPVVAITVFPRIGETTGSVLGNLFGGLAAGIGKTSYRGSYSYEFKADLKDCELVVNDKVQAEIQRGMSFVPMNFFRSDFYGSHGGTDMARAGQFIFPAEVFRDSSGSWPRCVLRVVSLEDPEDTTKVKLSRENLERIVVDFEPYWERIEDERIKLLVDSEVVGARDSILHVGMTLGAFKVLMGGQEPSSSTIQEFGTATDRPWKGLVLRYTKEQRNARFEEVDRWQINKYVFVERETGPLLNHWSEEFFPDKD